MAVSFKDKSGNVVRGFAVDRRDASGTGTTGTFAILDATTGAVIENVLDSANSTVDYPSGNFTITFASGIELLADSSPLIDYRYDNRRVGDGAIGSNQLRVPEINIRIDSMPVVCQSRKLKALYAFDAA